MRAVRSNTMCSSLELFPAVRVKMKRKKESEKKTETDTDIDADYPLSHFTSRDCRSISTSERERETERERGRAGMTGTGRVLTAVSFMGPVTISSCSEIREIERGEMGRNREFYSCKVYEV